MVAVLSGGYPSNNFCLSDPQLDFGSALEKRVVICLGDVGHLVIHNFFITHYPANGLFCNTGVVEPLLYNAGEITVSHISMGCFSFDGNIGRFPFSLYERTATRAGICQSMYVCFSSDDSCIACGRASSRNVVSQP